MTWLSFCAFGSAIVKAASKHVGEIDIGTTKIGSHITNLPENRPSMTVN